MWQSSFERSNVLALLNNNNGDENKKATAADGDNDDDDDDDDVFLAGQSFSKLSVPDWQCLPSTVSSLF